MSFLVPWAVWFAAGVPAIVLLYLLKLKRRPQTVSTHLFWQRVQQESRRRAFFQKLRQLFSLLLHLLIFLLILGALARPVFDRQVREGSSTVLIVDTRARMQAREKGGESRLSRAKKMAANYAGQASSGRAMAVLSSSAAPSVVAAFTTDEKELRAGIEGIEPTDASGGLAGAIQLATQILAARQGPQLIVIFTAPGGAPAIEPAPPTTGPEIRWVTVGEAQENLAILRFGARPLLTSPQTSEVLLEVANFGRQPAQTKLEVALDGHLLDVQPLSLGPGEHHVQVFPTVPRFAAGGRGWLTARLVTEDALPGDDLACAVLAAQPPRRVLLVTKGNWFLEKMLGADQGVTFELVAPDSYQPALAEKFDVVILDDFLPPDFQLARALGNFLFIKQTPFPASGAPLENPLISETDVHHPVLRLVNLQNVTVVRAAALASPAPVGDWRFETPIRSFDHPLLIVGERPAGAHHQRLAALALDVAESDLPLRVAFPLLMTNTLQWLAGESAAPLSALAAGESMTLAAGERAWLAPQSDPRHSALPPPGAAFAASLFQPLRNGFYLLQQADHARWVAVNTFSEAESDLRSQPRSAGGPAAHLPSVLALSGWPVWQYLALAALLLFVLEWRLFHRRRTE